jgi:elongator complex protein 3
LDYYEDFIASLVRGEATSRAEVLKLKAVLCKKHGLARVPTNYEILERVPDDLKERFEPLLKNKPIRTLSGVAPVAVMTSPYECPHGKCSYCPGGVGNNSPQSYTGREPAALRGGMHEYDPYRQTSARISQLRAIGHKTDKVDLIIMGGTFTSRPRDYQERFVKGCLDAMNGCKSADLESAQVMNETASSRCVGLTIETRPDCFGPEHIEYSLKLGVTKVELGVQILDDEILDGVNRGHHVEDVVRATSDAREAGLKICYHIMPALPGSSRELDLASFRMMFDDERFRPDMLKIYPTLVIGGTDLHSRWLSGGYRPMTLEEAIDLVGEMKKMVPPWVRILRIQRDIPVQLIEGGVRKSHLRELVGESLRQRGERCRCIRCREVGHVPETPVSGGCAEPEYIEVEYDASSGKELFLSYEVRGNGALIGYARLRLPLCSSVASLRELHVYGQMVPIDERSTAHWQHRGTGTQLLRRCEEIATDRGFEELRVTSGVGAREYYRRLGYGRKGPYMCKHLVG